MQKTCGRCRKLVQVIEKQIVTEPHLLKKRCGFYT